MTRSWLFVPGLMLLCACAPEGGKPTRALARRDALSTGVVISEVYGGGGSGTSTWRHDFVELFNRGNVAVDVSGWSVQYASDTGGGWQVTTLGTFGLLQPGQSLLVRMGTAGTTGMTLPAHDVSGGSLMSSTAGKVALVSSATALMGTCPAASAYVDLVGYGSSANCAEGGPTPNTSPTTSVSRHSNGCAETDSNAMDLLVGAPTPRNAAASALTCGAPPVDAGVPPVDAGCLTISSWPPEARNGGYDEAAQTAWGELSTQEPASADGGMDVLTLEAYFGFGLVLPVTEVYTDTTDYGTCEACASLSRGCNSAGRCTREYLGQGGTGTITIATRDAGAGQFSGSLVGVRFVEWDFMNDVPVAGGECVVLTGENIDATWGGPTGGGGGGGTATGGGAGGGSSTGGGAGGGSATGGGAGGSDAGSMEPDGGAGGERLGGKSGCGCSTGVEALLALTLLVLRRRAPCAR
ncbi:MAG: lamin tail domain-containing protein [Archangium sp.]|nr:lamin tail domain-containing protein [Archangium sp.]